MVVKKYKTKSIQEGVSKIKKELGPDAMILSTRRIRKNACDPYGKDRFEITALPGQPADSGYPTGAKTIREEISNIKEMLFLLSQPKGLPEAFQACPDSVKMYSRLIKSGISEKRVNTFFHKVFQNPLHQNPENVEIAKQVYQTLLDSIHVCNPFQKEASLQPSGSPTFAVLIGPTGVGKTTTIAKLAADLYLKHKKKVGLISVDNYRIGAVEQLKTYASIIGLPCLTAFTKEDITAAMRNLNNRDIVLVDTAGHSHLDTERMADLVSLLGEKFSGSCHLVLSATTKQNDMKDAVTYFSRLHPQTYIFTKIDETRQRGGILDQILDYPLPVSFVTTGQKVPEDILCATKRNLSRLILNRSRYVS
ncbi:MAG: protein FlhF [Desulfobacteraceae bacterium]|nr:MAG: protein FlhF [Desulfobacteraceae bacterium]